ncbi:solute carrier family member 27 [Nannochloropsis gaditana]|uniref:Solute carrier family member 27 n=1 Tax=Nannochloropsis gaditana TaxID=72520 RepID=W7T6F4_9STRA|nr:solute carrier family member 27 [Nannochloropsis gaditana]
MGNPNTSGLSFGTIYGLSCLSACVAETVTFPLDLFKTLLQAERISRGERATHQAYRSLVLSIFKEAVAKEQGGYMNLWRGLTPACLRHIVYSGSRLGLYEFWREDVLGRDADGSFPLHKAVAAGMLSGAIGQFFSSPADVVKVRMQTEVGRRRAGLPPLYRSTREAFVAIFREGGLRGLWRGWVPNCQRAALVQLGDLTTYDCTKQYLLRDQKEGGWALEDNARTHACASLAAGLVAAFLGTPADVVKTRCMNQPCDAVTGKGLLYRSSFDCLRSVVRDEGYQALWRGCFLNWLRMAPWSLAFYLSFEHLRRMSGLRSF